MDDDKFMSDCVELLAQAEGTLKESRKLWKQMVAMLVICLILAGFAFYVGASHPPQPPQVGETE